MEPLFESLSRAADGAYVIDADQRIVYWNPAAERLLGYRAEDVLGRACHEVLRGRDDDNRATGSGGERGERVQQRPGLHGLIGVTFRE